ncbi:hypothetical protein [Vibrio cyclitrophicus]|uniref:Uncharacterized protein n=1 Tax=Vibrio cyclitrophicus ZF270 TaxID=1136176 RepID=A0AAN0M300_9VIBR|nr:hypothetical protein [Vibrio cyclitrophicus]OED99703.1 hypothetical protein OC7_07230 [Vibrio cyclitrophicus ZF270]
MRISTYKLFKIGTSLIEKLEEDTHFDLYYFQSLLKPLIEPYYDPDKQLDRFRNHSYRMLKVLERKGIVIRLSGACVNNAKYSLIAESPQLEVEFQTEERPALISEELSYQAQLRLSKLQLNHLVIAHKQLIEKFPCHSTYLNEELVKLEKEISILECKALVIEKIIKHSEKVAAL